MTLSQRSNYHLFGTGTIDTIFEPIVQNPYKYGQIFFKVESNDYQSQMSQQHTGGIQIKVFSNKVGINESCFLYSNKSINVDGLYDCNIICCSFYNFSIFKYGTNLSILFYFVNNGVSRNSYYNVEMLNGDYFSLLMSYGSTAKNYGTFTFQVGAILL